MMDKKTSFKNKQFMMTNDEMNSLDEKTHQVEKQMYYLSNCLNNLSEQLAFQRQQEDELGKRIYKACSDSHSKGDSLRKSTLTNANCSPLPLNSMPTELFVDDSKLKLTNQELLNLLKEERVCKAQLYEQYESQLSYLRSLYNKEKIEDRKKVLNELDSVVRKYYTLAQEAVTLAKSERERSVKEKNRVQKIAEDACKEFEIQIKEKFKCALDTYRKLVYEAHLSVKEERQKLNEQLEKMEECVDQERRSFESRIMKEAEERIQHYMSENEALQNELQLQKNQYEKTLLQVCDTIEDKCKTFEKTLYSKMLHILWKNGVDMTEEDLMKNLKTASCVMLKEDIKENVDKELESDSPSRICNLASISSNISKISEEEK